MDPTLREILDLVLRWIHLIAGIMWVGNSMLFNWLDRNLQKRPKHGERSFGEIWLLHSGAYYEVEKKLLAPEEMPERLHWFKWQSYTTWMTGFLLLCVVYYLGGKSYLVDSQVHDMSYGTAVATSLGLLIGGFAVYDLIWRFLEQKKSLATALCMALAAGYVFAVSQLFTGRAAYIQVGALFGSIMAGNVFFHIVPSQKQMVGASARGELADPALSIHAKTRSIHNNYLTFPVLFIMISNHFPSSWGHTLNWVVLAILMLGGGTVRHFLNIRFTFPRWLPALLTTIALTIGTLLFMVYKPAAAVPAQTTQATAGQLPGTAPEKVAFPIVQAIVTQRCVPCHAAKPTDPLFAAAPAGGIQLDSPDKIAALSARIQYRAVQTKTMPFGNKTGITQQERDVLARWIAEGAALQ